MSNHATQNTHEALVGLVAEMLNGRGSMSFHFVQYNKDWSPVAREEAQNKANQLAAVLGVEVEEIEVENNVGSFVVENPKGNIRIIFSFVDGEEEN